VSLLLDTQVFLWFESGSAKLSDFLRRTIGREQNVYVSAASFLEIAIKQRAGKVAFKGSPRAAALAAGFSELAVGGMDAERASALDWDNGDPFDRMLVAHCLNRDIALVTADPRFRARNDITVMWAG
jgi:PIN domain nuclease of toxin-antitoxin system